jgi:hypothetical protein
MKKIVIAFSALLVAFLAFSGTAEACDGYYRIEKKNKRYEQLTLNKAQKTKIDALKSKWAHAFKDDHKRGACDAEHDKTVAKFAAEADGVLTSAQRMEIKTNEKLKALEKQISDLRREIAEMKRLIKSLARK